MSVKYFTRQSFVLFVADEINDLTDQLGESGRRVMEIEKGCKRLEMERDQVHATLEETEALVGQEQGKLQRLQVELSNAKTETERRLAEKDEEMENVRSVTVGIYIYTIHRVCATLSIPDMKYCISYTTFATTPSGQMVMLL